MDHPGSPGEAAGAVSGSELCRVLQEHQRGRARLDAGQPGDADHHESDEGKAKPAHCAQSDRAPIDLQ